MTVRDAFGRLNTFLVPPVIPINLETLTTEEREVYDQLPAELRELLSCCNGAKVDSPDSLNFITHVEVEYEGVNSISSDLISEFWGIGTDRADGVSDIAAEFSRHIDDEFLPRGVIAFAACPSDGLVCVSTNASDFGHIYYWDYYWSYPWAKPFFDKRIDAVRRSFPTGSEILGDPKHPDYWVVSDAGNYATLMDLAPNLTAFLQRCSIAGEEN